MATNASPREAARAPTPILRNEPEDVPARWLPSSNWARAGVARSSPASSAARATALEVIVELEPPLGPRPVVRRVVHLRLPDVSVVLHAREQRRIVGARAPHAAEPGHRVHPVDDVIVEDVRAEQAEVEAPPTRAEAPVEPQIGGELERRVLRVGLRRLLRERVRGRVGATRDPLDVEVEPAVLEERPALGRRVVE